LDTTAKYYFPETTERPGYFVGFVDIIGDNLIFKILNGDLVTFLHRRVVISTADVSHLNKRISF
jgi:hypothetical protein